MKNKNEINIELLKKCKETVTFGFDSKGYAFFYTEMYVHRYSDAQQLLEDVLCFLKEQTCESWNNNESHLYDLKDITKFSISVWTLEELQKQSQKDLYESIIMGEKLESEFLKNFFSFDVLLENSMSEADSGKSVEVNTGWYLTSAKELIKNQKNYADSDPHKNFDFTQCKYWIEFYNESEPYGINDIQDLRDFLEEEYTFQE